MAMSELVRFDGSVIIDRTAGEVAARCDMEAMNILTLNLVHDINAALPAPIATKS